VVLVVVREVFGIQVLFERSAMLSIEFESTLLEWADAVRLDTNEVAKTARGGGVDKAVPHPLAGLDAGKYLAYV